MGSFYGNGGWTGGEGSGTTNYNDLSNRPIVNLTGTESSPIVLHMLEYGIYLIKGFYHYNASDELKQFTSPINMQIFEDVATQQKVAKFEIIENQELIIITVFYDRNNDFIEDRLAIGSGGGSTSPIAEEIVLGTF